MHFKVSERNFHAFNQAGGSGYYQQDSGCKKIRAAACLVALCNTKKKTSLITHSLLHNHCG